jgi:hypothetical protein
MVCFVPTSNPAAIDWYCDTTSPSSSLGVAEESLLLPA